MIITRVTCQGSKSVLEFYEQELHRSGISRQRAGRCLAMLGLLKHLGENVDGPDVWAVTSHLTLNLKAVDDWDTPTLASISALSDPDSSDDYATYTISHPLPNDQAPWSGATVQGMTDDLNDATKMILIAIERSLANLDAQQ